MTVAREKGLRHQTSVIDASARLHPSVEVGPYCVIGPEVSIGEGTQLLSHVVLGGRIALGARNMIYPGACLGFPPQAKPITTGTALVVGDDNVIREHVTMHTGTKEPGTRVGSRNYFMAGSHVGHDCLVADEVTLANGTALGGHVIVEEKVVIGGLCGVHQHVRIGKYAMIGGLTKPTQDVLPFTLVDGRPDRLAGVNVVGLRRNKFSAESIRDVRRAVRMILFAGAKYQETLVALRTEFSKSPEVGYMLRFIEQSKRGVVRRGSASASEDEA